MESGQILSDDLLEMAVGGVSTGEKAKTFYVQVKYEEDYQWICKAVREAGKAVSLTGEQERTVCSKLSSLALSQGKGRYEVTLGSDIQVRKAV